MAIDGVQLGPTAAVRAAGAAVLVAFRPVFSPYRIEAIGPADALETALAASPAGQRLHTAAAVYGLGIRVRRAGRLSLAGPLAPHLSAPRALTGGTR